mgnify:CR=1 FL=1
MNENFVHVEGVVKRDSEATSPNKGVMVMDFCLEVPTGLGDRTEVYVDCFAATDACRQVDGFVEKGERLSVEGRLTFKTITDYNGNKKSRMMVYAESIESLDEEYEEEL